MKPRYVVCPGNVTSKTDGQRHYIGAMQLMRLYRVRPEECEIYEPAPWWPASYYRMEEERHRGLPRLYPRYDGNYSLTSSPDELAAIDAARDPTVRNCIGCNNYRAVHPRTKQSYCLDGSKVVFVDSGCSSWVRCTQK